MIQKFLLTIFFFLALSPLAFSASSDIAREISLLNREKKKIFVAMIVDAKKSCASEISNKAEARTCFRTRVKFGVLDSVRRFRTARKSCQQEGIDRLKFQKCSLELYLEKKETSLESFSEEDLDSSIQPSFSEKGKNFLEKRSTKIELVPCDFDGTGAQRVGVVCGLLSVPEYHENPQGRQIQIAFAFLKSKKEVSKKDPLLFLSGGPAQQSMNTSLLNFWLQSPFHKERDIFLLDQRGVGFSRPALECPEADIATANALFSGKSRSDLFRDISKSLTACHDRLVSEGIAIGAYTVAQSVQDIELLRKELGYNQWNIYGVSHGTRVSLMLMDQFPKGIRSAVLDSLLPSRRNIITSLKEDLGENLQEIFQACFRDKACKTSYGNISVLYSEALQQVSHSDLFRDIKHPYTQEILSVPLTPELLKVVALHVVSIEGLGALVQFFQEVSSENYDTIEKVLAEKRMFEDEISMGAHMAYQCSENAKFSQESVGASQIRVLDTGRSRYENTLRDKNIYFSSCSTWNQEKTIDTTVSSKIAVPALLFSGEYDEITPSAWGEEALKYFKEARHIVIPNMGHSSSINNECSIQMIHDFLDDPKAPLDDSCLEVKEIKREEIPLGDAQGVSDRAVCYRFLKRDAQHRLSFSFPLGKNTAKKTACYYPEFDWKGRPTEITYRKDSALMNDPLFSVKYILIKYDPLYAQETYAFFDGSGNPTASKQGVFHEVVQRGEEDLGIFFFDEKGEKMKNKEKVYGYQILLDKEGRKEMVIALGKDGQGMINAEGITQEKRYYDGDLLQARAFYGRNGSLRKEDSSGVAVVRFEYNADSLPIKTSFFDEEENPVQHRKLGIFIEERTYDKNGNIVLWKGLDAEGNSLRDKKGIFSIAWIYDAFGNLVEEKEKR